jgi:hypothetical protein
MTTLTVVGIDGQHQGRSAVKADQRDSPVRLKPETTSEEARGCNEAPTSSTSLLLLLFHFELEMVPVRGFAKGWIVNFEGIAA